MRKVILACDKCGEVVDGTHEVLFEYRVSGGRAPGFDLCKKCSKILGKWAWAKEEEIPF